MMGPEWWVEGNDGGKRALRVVVGRRGQTHEGEKTLGGLQGL